ncbi:XapX domain-containing protein [Undibacterium terreum]|uniref:XapX domain-containing protein n=1 Tax=Undibacterium terreum TaxID=1224302 RepID=UPI0016645D25|nr:XapX domain-containing protein [Undibacterium terreum]
MMIYLISLGAGVLMGFIYGLIGVRSPAPPAVALVGLLGMLAGGQILPIAKQLLHKDFSLAWFRHECAPEITGVTPPVATKKENS